MNQLELHFTTHTQNNSQIASLHMHIHVATCTHTRLEPVPRSQYTVPNAPIYMYGWTRDWPATHQADTAGGGAPDGPSPLRPRLVGGAGGGVVRAGGGALRGAWPLHRLAHAALLALGFR